MSDNLLQTLGYVPEHEVAAALGVEITTLRNWRSKGLGPPYSRGGNTLLYPVGGLRDWIEQNMVHPAPSTPPLTVTPRRPGRPRKTEAA